MITKEQIIEKLREAGFTDDRLDAVMSDVTRMAMLKAIASVFSGLPKDQRAMMASLAEDQLVKYVTEHSAELPKLSTAGFEQVYDATWQSYFSSVAPEA